MTSTHVRTCHICEANCGILVELDGREVVSIRGDPDNPLSRGHICPKATAIADLQNDPDRLRRPVKRTPAGWQEIDWDAAYAEIAARFGRIARDGGSNALYLGNPNAHNYATSLQTKQLRKALGLRAIYSASTLDQIPHQLVQMWMYGHNALFPIADIDRTRVMVIIGGNPLACAATARARSGPLVGASRKMLSRPAERSAAACAGSSSKGRSTVSAPSTPAAAAASAKRSTPICSMGFRYPISTTGVVVSVCRNARTCSSTRRRSMPCASARSAAPIPPTPTPTATVAGASPREIESITARG